MGGGGREVQTGDICVYIQLAYFAVQQKLTQACKAIILQFGEGGGGRKRFCEGNGYKFIYLQCSQQPFSHNRKVVQCVHD